MSWIRRGKINKEGKEDKKKTWMKKAGKKTGGVEIRKTEHGV